MARTMVTAEHQAGDEVSVATVGGHEIAFNLSLARRILAARPRKAGRFRLTADGRSRLRGPRAAAQRSADASMPVIIATVDDLRAVLEGQSRMDAALGMPRFFPAYTLDQDETARCVMPRSRRIYLRLLKASRGAAV